MAPLTQDRNTPYFETLTDLPRLAKGAVKIYRGAMTCRGADGYLIPAANTSGLEFDGVSQENVDTTGIADGVKKCIVRRCGIWEFAAAGLAITDIGKPVYVSDDQTVTLTPGHVCAGKLVGIDGATVAQVDIEAATRGHGFGRSRQFAVQAKFNGAVTEVEKTVLDGLELPCAATLKELFIDAQTAPGGAKKCTAHVKQGAVDVTLDLSAAAVHAENKALDQALLAGTDIDITLVDDHADAVTADVTVTLILESVE
jgi:hypothetical protein